MTTTITPQSDPVGGKLVTYTQAAGTRTTESGVTGAADDIFAVEVINATADAVFLKIFDTVAAVVPGTTAPNWVFRVAANTTLTYACPDALVVATGISLFISLDGGTGVAELSGPKGSIVAYLLTV